MVLIKKEPSAVVFGCSGPTLTKDEVLFFRESQPYGFILFSRNIVNPLQLKNLILELREIIGRKNAPILIDQEGGSVQRLTSPHWRDPPPVELFGKLYKNSRNLGIEACRLNHRIIAAELFELGINVDCSPVLDVQQIGANKVIGDRAFSSEPLIVAELGRAACEGLLEGGVLPVIKHLPGHGRALSDSHAELPIINTSEKELKLVDFKPFQDLASMPWGMTAHIVYSKIDQKYPATLSPFIIKNIIRNFIGFNGLLISDDICMKALSGNFIKKARKTLDAGCDLVLHCSGDLNEMRETMLGVHELSESAKQRVLMIESSFKKPEQFDIKLAIEKFESLLKTTTEI